MLLPTCCALTPHAPRLCCRPAAGVYYSVPLKIGQRASVAISANGQRLAVVAENGPVLCSADGGHTWVVLLGAASWHHISMSSDGTRLLAALWEAFLYRSTNFGGSWDVLAMALNLRKW